MVIASDTDLAIAWDAVKMQEPALGPCFQRQALHCCLFLLVSSIEWSSATSSSQVNCLVQEEFSHL